MIMGFLKKLIKKATKPARKVAKKTLKAHDMVKVFSPPAGGDVK